jgi:hypothetical protein
MNDNHEGPVPPGAGRSGFDRTRDTTFVSTSDSERLRDDPRNPGAAEPGLRDFSSTMAWMRASSGPFGPRFLGHRVDENSQRPTGAR